MGVVFGAKIDQIRSNVVKNKETGISMGFFHIMHEVYIYRQEVAVIETTEWKLKA